MRRMAKHRMLGPALTAALTAFALLVHGYHPYAEDGGVYLAGVEYLLHPGLFPAFTGFVTEHLRFSLFAPLIAGLARGTHLSLSVVVFLLYLLSVWGTLFAAWMLARRIFSETSARVGAVALLACWLTLPIAGTSLILADPYLTARSFSTPLALFALALALDAMLGQRHRWIACAVALLLAAAMHPLMTAYATAAVLLLACAGSRAAALRRWGPLALGVLALLIAGIIQAHAPAESVDYVRVVLTRYYWFPARWEWYEQLGVIAPLALIALLVRSPGATASAAMLGRVALTLGSIALAVALLFGHESSRVHAVARLQPLRCFALVYEIFALLLGGWLGHIFSRDSSQRTATTDVTDGLGQNGSGGDPHIRSYPYSIRDSRVGVLLAAALVCGLAAVMFFVQRHTYPASAHLELPGRAPANLWEQAFVWVRDNTPQDAVFALDARYITRGHGEDAQCFRAIAQRSALPDYSKDGGEASISPWLTEAWTRGQTAQTDLEQRSDSSRATTIKPLGADWIVLERRSPTAWECPYSNAAVKVCKVP